MILLRAARVDLIEKGTLSKDFKEEEFALSEEKGLYEKRRKQAQRP